MEMFLVGRSEHTEVMVDHRARKTAHEGRFGCILKLRLQIEIDVVVDVRGKWLMK